MNFSTETQKQIFEPHYSTKFFRAYRNYLRDNYSEDLFKQICSELKVPESFLLSDFNWISHDFYLAFLGRLKTLTGDGDINYKLGKALLHRDNINPFEYELLKIFPPMLYYALLPHYTNKLNRLSNYKLISIKPGKAIIEIISTGKIKHNLDVCSNIIGMAEGSAIPLGLDNVQVQHTQCVHRGDSHCYFEINYTAKKLWFKRISSIAFLALCYPVTKSILSLLGINNTTISILACTSSLLLISLILLVWKFSALIRHQGIVSQQHVIKDSELVNNRAKLNFSSHESDLLKDLAITLNEGLSPNEILERTLNELKNRFGYGTGIVMLLNEATGQLHTQKTIGFDEHPLANLIYQFKIKYPNPNSLHPDLFANILDHGKTRLINDISSFSQTLLKPENKLLIESLKVNSLIASPIVKGQTKYGLLIVGRAIGNNPLNQYDQSLIEKIVQLLTLAFTNATQLDNERNLKNLFKKYVPAIVLDGLEGTIKSNEYFAPKNMHIASIFVDLRDFTKISENLDPSRVRLLLSEYVSFVTKHLAESGGYIDKITGDGINAFYLKKVDSDNPSQLAYNAAIAMLTNSSSLRKRFNEMGFPPPVFGVGINSGPAIVGAFGSEHKLEYAALGNTVNTASRLQTLCKDVTKDLNVTGKSMMVCSSSVLNEVVRSDVLHPTMMSYAVRGIKEKLNVAVYLEPDDYEYKKAS